MDETKGFSLEHGIWKRLGWEKMDELRKILENVKELRDLVRSLGRAGGKGPKRKAPSEVLNY